ncbi:MAG: menaquinone biosynthesis protein [Spirochaetota bacterium]
MKLGYIDYLNCYPFYYHMFEKDKVADVKIFPGYPSNLNRMMMLRELDMSPISAGAYPDIVGHAALLTDFCLSSVGYVGSVNLVSKVPIEVLDGKAIGVTNASATSVALMKILLERFYGIKPSYVPSPPLPDMNNFDAALLIGNEAMMTLPVPIAYKYDLGELWFRKTGYPVVFAVFAVQKSALDTFKKQIADIIGSYNKSLDCMKAEKDMVVKKAKKRYPDIVYNIDFYYSLFQYEFTKELKEALKFYFDIAAEMGLLKKIDIIETI